MDKETLVYVDLDGGPHLMGRLWARVRKNKESATFEYDHAWLQHPARFSLEPALQLGPGPFHTQADTPHGTKARRTRGGRTAPHASGNRLPAAGGR
jgi:serine/threonine-protein kinase HipA